MQLFEIGKVHAIKSAFELEVEFQIGCDFALYKDEVKGYTQIHNADDLVDMLINREIAVAQSRFLVESPLDGFDIMKAVERYDRQFNTYSVNRKNGNSMSIFFICEYSGRLIGCMNINPDHSTSDNLIELYVGLAKARCIESDDYPKPKFPILVEEAYNYLVDKGMKNQLHGISLETIYIWLFMKMFSKYFKTEVGETTISSIEVTDIVIAAMDSFYYNNGQYH